MAEIRINATGGVKLYDADDSHYAQIVAGTITSNVDLLTLNSAGITVLDGAIDFDIASHDTSNGLKLGGTLVTATAAELNIMDGVTATAAEINLIDGGTSRGTTALASGDGILINDGGTMRMTNVDTVKTFMSPVTALNNATADELVTVGSTTTELDAEASLIFNGSALGIGTSSPNVRLGQGLDIADSANYGGMSLSCWSTTDGHQPIFDFKKSGNATIGSHTIVADGEYLGHIGWRGSDGSAFVDSVSMRGEIDGTPGSNDMPGRLLFMTTPDGSSGGTERLRLTSTGEIATGGETAPDVAAGGICIDTNAASTFALTFKNSDVAHGITTQAETDTHMRMSRYDANGGGAQVGYSESTIGLYFQGIVTTANTAKSTSSVAPMYFRANIKSGTDGANMSSNGNLFAVANGGNAAFVVDAEGELHSDGGAQSAYDEYDDAQLIRACDLSRGKGTIDSKFDKFIAYNHEHLADLKLVGREDDGTPNHFVNITGLQRLHNGAIWQQYTKHQQLLEAVYDLAKEAVGEEKANAILEKHEVKRLQ